MDNHSHISGKFRPKSKCVQFYVTCLGKSFIVYANCVNGLSHDQILETTTSHVIVKNNYT